MSSNWLPFLPYSLAHDLSQDPAAATPGCGRRLAAVVMFADISGFTPMSEALAATGRGGAELLTRLLNNYFSAMIALVESYGGITAKFGGDAMTVFFPYSEATLVSEATEVTRRSLACALAMQAHMSAYAGLATPAGSFSLTMKAGLAAGPLLAVTVGDPEVRLEYVIAGSALDRCAAAEHCAGPGEVVISDDLLARSGLEAPEILAEPIRPERPAAGAGFYRLLALQGADPAAARPPLAGLPPLPRLQPAALETVAAFLHPSIARRLQSGQTSFVNEHRQVTVLFACFEGLDYDRDPAVAAHLQGYLVQVVHCLQRYDGYLNKVDMGDKGSKFIALFGAPVAHEDDPARALHCALELRSLGFPSEGGAGLRIGIHSGFVYCGQVGAPQRQEYTVMGDAVNLAARLMQTATAGQTLVSAAAQRLARARFAWEPAGELLLKGKSEPVTAFRLLGERRGQGSLGYALPVVGRQAELERLRHGLERARQGRGQIFALIGEAGLGKSRLSAEVLLQAEELGFTCLRGECLSHESGGSYQVWHSILSELFGLDPLAPPGEQAAQLETALAALDPAFTPRLPLLAPALNLPIPDNDLTRELDARLRKASLEALLVACLRLKSRQEPLCLGLEDCHWIDPLSDDLLTAAGRGLADAPVFILLAYRPPDAGRQPPGASRLANFTALPLAEFTPAEAGRLIELKLAQRFAGPMSLPSGLLRRLIDRSQGNPFYIEQMIDLLCDRSSNPRDSATLELPASLHSLIISRIDRLAESVQTTLKVASVIGRAFQANWLWGVYPSLGLPERVKEQLDELSQMEITSLVRSEPELEYLFKHILTREVAYESLAVATRAMLHEQVGQFIERSLPGELDRFLDLLAYHYGRSENRERQREYFRRAGAAARGIYANAAAIDYYRRLLPLLEEPEKGAILLDLAGVLRLSGNWKEAKTTLDEALAVAERRKDRPGLARARLASGSLQRYRGEFPEALSWLESARGLFAELDDLSGVNDARRETGIVHWSQGDYPAALACFEACRQISLEQDDRTRQYLATGNMGLVYWQQGESDAALECFETCYRMAQEGNDRPGIAAALANLGNVYVDREAYRQAQHCFVEYLELATQLGDRQGIGIAVGNLGNVYWWQGDYPAARACSLFHLQMALELGDRPGVGNALWCLGDGLLAEGELAAAGRVLEPAIALARDLQTDYELCDYLYSYAELLTRQERYGEAQAANQEALALGMDVEHPEIPFKAGLLAPRLGWLLGELDLPAALAALNGMLDEWPEEREQAAIHHAIWRLDPGQEASRAQAAEGYGRRYAAAPNAEARQRYYELTGEWLPALPELPALPGVVTRQPADLDSLLAQVSGLLAAG